MPCSVSLDEGEMIRLFSDFTSPDQHIAPRTENLSCKEPCADIHPLYVVIPSEKKNTVSPFRLRRKGDTKYYLYVLGLR